MQVPLKYDPIIKRYQVVGDESRTMTAEQASSPNHAHHLMDEYHVMNLKKKNSMRHKWSNMRHEWSSMRYKWSSMCTVECGRLIAHDFLTSSMNFWADNQHA